MASAGRDVNHLDESYNGDVDILDNAYVIFDFKNGARALDLCMFAEASRHNEELCAIGETESRMFVAAKYSGARRAQGLANAQRNCACREGNS